MDIKINVGDVVYFPELNEELLKKGVVEVFVTGRPKIKEVRMITLNDAEIVRNPPMPERGFLSIVRPKRGLYPPYL